MGMGMMTGQMGVPPGATAEKKKKQSKKSKESDEDFDDVDDAEEESEEEEESRSSGRRRRRGDRRHRNRGRRGRSRGRERTPERLPEVEKFIDENRINPEAAGKMRALSPESQRRVIARPLTGDVQNPSKVMIARVRELISQNEKAKSSSSSKQPDAYAMWSGAMLGATPEAIQKFIDDNDLDDSASRSLRALAPHHQATALRWDVSRSKNPSAKFMSMAAELARSPAPPPSMPMPMYCMPPPGGIPAMYGMPPPGMHPGMMPPPMYSMPPPGMGPPPMMGRPP